MASQSTLVTTALQVPLGQLRPGHEAIRPVNIRVPSDGPDLAAMAANIADRLAAKRPPLIEPLLVVEGSKPRGRKAGGPLYYVCDGGRRLAALMRLREQGLVTDALTLPVVVHAWEEGLEVSTTAAVLAAPHHPVEQYEAFAALAAARGDRPEADTVAFLARRFAITPRRVRQILALGALAPEVRAAWREGRIDKATAEAFTATEDKGRQAALLAALEERGGRWELTPHAVRRELLAGRIRATGEIMDAVGIETYLAAGGTLTGDLFTADRYVADEALARRLHKQVRQALEESIRAEGWGYVFWADDARATGWWHWRKPDAAAPDAPVWTAEAAAERDRLKAEIVALDATAKAATAEPETDDGGEDDDWDDAGILAGDGDEDATDGPSLADQRNAAVRALQALTNAALRAAVPAEVKAGLAAILEWQRGSGGLRGRLLVHAGYVPPGLDQEAPAGDDGEPGDDDADGAEGEAEGLDDAGAASAPEPEPADLPRAALQALSLIANRAAAATLSGEPRLALAMLAAAWIARNSDWRTMHDKGRMAPLVVNIRGLGHGLADTDKGQADRRTFGQLVDELQSLPLSGRLDMLARLVGAALAIDEDTLAADRAPGRDRRVSRLAAQDLVERLPPATYERHCELLLAAEAEAVFAEWPKAALVAAIAEMDGEEAAAHAAKAKKAALVALVAERAKATGWLPQGLRGRRPPAGQEETAGQEEAA